MTLRILPAFAAIAACLAAVAAGAHPALVSSTPAAAASVAKPSKIVLGFSEKIVGAVSGATLAMTSMPGMAMTEPMKMTGFTSAVSPDGKTLTLLLKHPLPTGAYTLDWHVAGADTHRAQGRLSFAVK